MLALTGHSDAPGLSADRAWAIPADQARRLVAAPGARHDWYSLTYRPEGTAPGPSTTTRHTPRRPGFP